MCVCDLYDCFCSSFLIFSTRLLWHISLLSSITITWPFQHHFLDSGGTSFRSLSSHLPSAVLLYAQTISTAVFHFLCYTGAMFKTYLWFLLVNFFTEARLKFIAPTRFALSGLGTENSIMVYLIHPQSNCRQSFVIILFKVNMLGRKKTKYLKFQNFGC